MVQKKRVKQQYIQLDQRDWGVIYKGRYYIERQMETYDALDKRQWSSIKHDMPEIKFVTILALKNNKFVPIGYRCTECDKTYKSLEVIQKHKDVCKRLNSIKKSKEEQEFMPVHRITKNGKTMYRWGDHGKLYPTKEEAERQGRAIHAAGYKEPKDKKDNK